MLEPHERFTEPICKLVSILLTKKNSILPADFDITQIGDFEISFKMRDFIKKNFETFTRMCPVSVWSEDSCTKYIISLLDENTILSYRDHSGFSLMSQLIKFSSNEIIWECLEKILPKDASDEFLRPRLDLLLKKDGNDLNLIDYSFIRRKNVVGEYVQSLLTRIKGSESVQQFPQLV